jgi:hypothetical protein
MFVDVDPPWLSLLLHLFPAALLWSLSMHLHAVGVVLMGDTTAQCLRLTV